jgi:phage repressor protein C with HTH and peptisase S24 domain
MENSMKRLYDAALHSQGISTPTELARAMGVSPQVITNWESRGVSQSGLVKAQKVLGCSPVWLASGAGEMFVNKDMRQSGFALRADVSIPLLAAKGSMGDGELVYEGDQIIDMMPLAKEWVLRNIKSPPEALRVITGAGDSMEPTFKSGDLLLVDTSKTTVDIDGVYVLSAHNRLFIKRVRQRLSGEFEISSDNPTVKTVDVLTGSSQVTVHGRVVWAWNGKGM